MFGQPVSMLIPLVVGVRLTGKLREGSTATDLVLTITEMLRKHGVVGKFVEFFGPGLPICRLPIAPPSPTWRPNTARPAASSPSTPKRLSYLRLTGRTDEQIALVEAYCQANKACSTVRTSGSRIFRVAHSRPRVRSSPVGRTQASARPRSAFKARSFDQALPTAQAKAQAAAAVAAKRLPRSRLAAGRPKVAARQQSAWKMPKRPRPKHVLAGHERDLRHGSVVIAAITSCTNTSNPSVMIAAGLLAKKAVERGLNVHPG